MLVNLTHKIFLAVGKVWRFLRPRKKLGLVSFVLLSTFILVVWFGVAKATAGDLIDDPLGWALSIASSIFLFIAEWFIKMTIFILKFVIEIAGYNGYIDSPAVIVGWVMVRDVVNMFFVVILLVIAFGTILGLQSYEWSKLLMKLLLVAVLVNFSRIIAGVVIDVAQVVMITFINGVAATAGGNLINMFNLKEIAKLTGNDPPTGGGMFLASVAALTFSGMMMMTMAVYLFMLLARMVTLWILIVLSPLMFVLKVLPQTEKFSGELWKQFSGNAIAGPVIAFFLWLAFVTAGSGNIYNEISEKSAISESNKMSNASFKKDVAGGSGRAADQTAGITEIMTFPAMANFLVAIGMLLAGAKAAQSLGAAGAGAMGKVGEFGKKIAMVASGARAGMWAGRGAVAEAKKGAKWVGMNIPVVGGAAWQRRGGEIKSAIGTWYGKRLEKKAILANKWMNIGAQKYEGTPGEKAGLAAKKFGARLGRWFLTPEALKKELADDKEKVNKMQREIALTHTLSGSKTPLGIAKTETEARLEKKKREGMDIKARKLAEAEELYVKNIVAPIEESLEEKIEKKEEELKNRGEERSLTTKEVDKLYEEVAEEKKLSMVIKSDYKRRLNARRSKAAAENIGEIMELKKQEATLRAKADDYRKRGNALKADEYDRAADSLEIGKLREGLKGRRGQELVAIIEMTARDIKTARDGGKANETQQKQKELFVAMNLARGHDEAWVARAADLAVIKGAEVDISGLSDQEIALSIDLAGNTRSLGLSVPDAAKEIADFLGGLKKAQGAFRERSIVNEKNTVMGITERSDMIGERITPTGKTEYKMNANVLTQPAAVRPQMQGNKQLMNLHQTINAPISLRNRDVATGKISNVEDAELGILADKLINISTKVGIDKINDKLIEDLNNAVVTSAAGQQAIKKFYEDMLKDMKTDAKDVFMARTKKFYAQRAP